MNASAIISIARLLVLMTRMIEIRFDTDPIQIDARDRKGQTESYSINLSRLDGRFRNELIGSFVMGLMKIRNTNLFDGDPLAIICESLQEMARLDIPEIDFMAYLSFSTRAESELNISFLRDAEKHLERAARKGHEGACAVLPKWTAIRRDTMKRIEVRLANRKPGSESNF